MLILAIIGAYLIGSIPFGYLLSYLAKGIDIRQHGSGNFGATNVFRVINPALGILVLVLDIVKGLVAVTILGDFVLAGAAGLDPILVRLVLGFTAVCGHNWTIFLQFKGGKGVATSVGVLLGLSLKITQLGLIVIFCLGIWLLIVVSTGFVSLGSIVAAVAVPVLMTILHQPFQLILFGIILCLFVVYRHKSNIRRLLRGEEKKIFPPAKH